MATTSKRNILTLPPAETNEPATTALKQQPPQPTKIARLIVLLRQLEGASVEEIGEALGWLPHTVRAALTGLRKKGHDIVRSRIGSVTVYRIAE